MLNTTILSLNILSMMNNSPIYLLSNSYQAFPKTTFINSHFSYIFSNVFVSFTTKHDTTFQNCMFSNVLDSSIKLSDGSNSKCFLKTSNKTKNTFKYGVPIENKTIKTKSYFIDSCGNITIKGCIFNGCHSTLSNGGAVEIEQKCFVFIHNTIFNNSSTDSNCGGACYIVKSQGDDEVPDFDDKQLPRLDVQYCCFQNCYGNYNLYGVALFSASKKTTLYFTSTVNCPGFQKTPSSGAQFDMQSDSITSKYVNASQGYAFNCAGIEYRYTSSGFFKFQTICEMVCMFAIAYTDIDTDNLELSYSNIYNISLMIPGNNGTNSFDYYPGIVYVINTDVIKIDHFCFFDIDFGPENTNSKLVSRGFDVKTRKIQPIHIVLIDCTYDCSDFYVAAEYSPNMNNQELIGCQSNTVKSIQISHLDLGECKGNVTPPLVATNPADNLNNSNNNNSNKNKTKIAMIAGITVGAVVLIVLIILISIVVASKHKYDAIKDIELAPSDADVIYNENTIYDKKAEEDPFKDDFQ